MPLWKSAAFASASAVCGLLANCLHQGVAQEKALAHQPIYDGKHKSTFSTHFEHFVLGEKMMLAQDVALFRFLLHDSNDVFDLKPCSTLQARYSTGQNIVEQCQRAYTPVTPYGAKGYFDILVKKQHKGRMTEHLFSMQPGEKCEFRVAVHKLHYVPNRWTYVGAIAGGTGISSVLQVIREICGNPDDKTKVSLLYGNQSESKILLRNLLDNLAAKHKDRFKVHYTIDKTDDTNAKTWTGFVGHMDCKMVEKTIPPPHKDNLILVCGPDGMMNALCGSSVGVLKAMSGGLPQQPLGGSLNNMNTTIEGVLGSMGYKGEYVYRF